MNNKLINKIAKKLIASQVGNSFYRIMDKQNNEISINFSIKTMDRDEFMIWMDSMLSKPTEIKKLAKPFKFEDMPDTMDTIPGIEGMFFSVCLKGQQGCDMEGLIKELKSKYNCSEIK